MDVERLIEAAAFILACATAWWAAISCRNALHRGAQGGDSRAWTLVAMLFLALACSRVIHAGPWVGMELRHLVRAHGLYGSRRPYQIAATLALAGVAVVAFTIGLRSVWEALKRYRLAASCIAVIVASAAIRFVSLHEVDAWNQEWPWIRIGIDLVTSALATAAALARVRQVARLRSAA